MPTTPSQGPLSPGACADFVGGGGGTIAWATPANARVSDDVYTTATGVGLTHYLRSRGFSFTIPNIPAITILGIVVEVERKAVNTVRDAEVKLGKLSSGPPISDNRADTADDWPAADAYATYGGPTDLWGLVWSVDDINNNLNVLISANQSGAAPVGSIDHVRVTVYYQDDTVPSYQHGSRDIPMVYRTDNADTG